MKFPIISVALVGFSILTVPIAYATDVNIMWLEPEEYQDIETSNMVTQKQFEQRVIDQLGSYIQMAADKYLSEGQEFNMTVTDIDLAGNVEYFFTRFPTGVRVLRNLYFPSIEFNYELRDAEGLVLKSGHENIKDMGYRYSGLRIVDDASLSYEKQMIDDWFKKTFSES